MLQTSSPALFYFTILPFLLVFVALNRDVNLSQSVAKQFRNEEIDGAAFFKLGDQDFDSLCLKIGTRKVIEQLIEDANNHSS